jgi:hypothetical protein
MQPDDNKDTVEVSRLKRLFWDLENRHREYPTMPVAETQEYILDVVPILVAYAERNQQPAINRVFPREPLPADNKGRLENGEAIRGTLIASATKAVERGITNYKPDTRVIRFDASGKETQ